jgi:immune inhibitor A
MSFPQASDHKKKSTFIVLAGFVLLLIICTVCLCIAFAAYLLFNAQGQFSSLSPSLTITPTPLVIRPPLDIETDTGYPTQGPLNPVITPQTDEQQVVRPTLSGSLYFTETLSILENTSIPLNDPIELAQRLGGIDSIPQTLEPPDAPYQIGMRELFWVGNMDNNTASQVTAVLRYITDHSYFWIEEGLDYNEDELRELAQAFETHIYPTTRDFFGSEWTPGIDGDPHLYILYARDLGENLAGYFSATDEYPPQVHEYSNGHEMFFFNADVISLGEPYTYGVLAHEFQHMILWNRDRNEASWINEGFSELAAFLNGYFEGSFVRQYTLHPDTQLNDWPDHLSTTATNYGASFLFINYFMDRFGAESVQAIIAHPEDGFSGIDAVLAQSPVYDPLRGKDISTDEVYLDWTIATYLNDPEAGDGRYAYSSYSQVPQPSQAERIHSCHTGDLTRDVAQYGVDYIRITCDGEHTLHFEGSIQVNLLPTDPHSGSYAFWSNKGDEAEMTLTRQFDFRTLSAPLSLNYWTWYDIEADYDYLYLMASTDAENWQILRTPSGTAEDPSGNSFGWAYNGVSGGTLPAEWIQETIDLSQFAGETVYLRFEYLTDAAVHGEGLLLDDISIPQAGYFSDFENDDGGWVSDGWVRVQNNLPQTFQLALISFGESTSVEYLPLGEEVTYDIPISIGGDVDEVVLVVTGTTRYTRQRAAYRFSVNP